MLEDNVIAEDDAYEDAEDLEGNLLYQALTETPDSEVETEDEDEDMEGLEAVDGDSEEVLRTKLTAKNRILRQRGKSNSRLKDRVEELEQKLNSGSGGLNKEDIKDILAAGRQESVPVETEEKKLEALRERIEEDPSAIIDVLSDKQAGLEQKLAKILQDRDAYWEAKLSKVTADAQPAETPEVMRLVGLLRNKAEYANADEATLVSFARDLAPLGKRVGKRPPAMTSGKRILPTDASADVVGKHYATELDKMGYGQD